MPKPDEKDLGIERADKTRPAKPGKTGRDETFAPPPGPPPPPPHQPKF